jgi:ribonuclease P protein component
MPRLRFPRARRLTSGADIERVRRAGTRIRCGRLEVRVVVEPAGGARVGIIVPRYRETAVARNRVKRRLREIVRQELLPRLPSVSVLVRARPEAYAATLDSLKHDVRGARTRIERLLAPSPEVSA